MALRNAALEATRGLARETRPPATVVRALERFISEYCLVEDDDDEEEDEEEDGKKNVELRTEHTADMDMAAFEEERDALKSAYELVARERDEAYAIRERARHAESESTRRIAQLQRRIDATHGDIQKLTHVLAQVYAGDLLPSELGEFARAAASRSADASP